MSSTATSTSKLAALRPFLIVLVALAIAVGLYQLKPEQAQQSIESKVMLVDAIEVFNETIQLKIPSQGTVTPSTETKLSSEVQGRIIAVGKNFVAGGFVHKGDLLLRIDDLEYKTALARAQASVASAKTLLAEERGRAEVAYQDWLRYNKEGKRTKQAKSLALREPQIAEAIANLDAAKADLSKAKENLSRTNVTAPYDGLVRSRDVDLGQHVSVGTALGVCFSTAEVEVRLPVPEHKVALLNLPAPNSSDSQTIAIELSVNLNEVEYRWPASLERIESVLDDRSRVLYVIAKVDDPYQLANNSLDSNADTDTQISNSRQNPPLRVGTFVNASIAGITLDNIIRVPQNVLQTDNKVWLVDNNGNMYEQAVKVIASDSEFAYIASGLNNADRIAMGYVDVSIPGAKVAIANLIQLPAATPIVSPSNTPNETAPNKGIPAREISAGSESVAKTPVDSTANTAARGI